MAGDPVQPAGQRPRDDHPQLLAADEAGVQRFRTPRSPGAARSRSLRGVRRAAAASAARPPGSSARAASPGSCSAGSGRKSASCWSSAACSSRTAGRWRPAARCRGRSAVRPGTACRPGCRSGPGRAAASAAASSASRRCRCSGSGGSSRAFRAACRLQQQPPGLQLPQPLVRVAELGLLGLVQRPLAAASRWPAAAQLGRVGPAAGAVLVQPAYFGLLQALQRSGADVRLHGFEEQRLGVQVAEFAPRPRRPAGSTGAAEAGVGQEERLQLAGRLRSGVAPSGSGNSGAGRMPPPSSQAASVHRCGSKPALLAGSWSPPAAITSCPPCSTYSRSSWTLSPRIGDPGDHHQPGVLQDVLVELVQSHVPDPDQLPRRLAAAGHRRQQLAQVPRLAQPVLDGILLLRPRTDRRTPPARPRPRARPDAARRPPAAGPA